MLTQKNKTEKIQLRTTKYLKSMIDELSKVDGVSRNSLLNQAVSWYVEKRGKYDAQ